MNSRPMLNDRRSILDALHSNAMMGGDIYTLRAVAVALGVGDEFDQITRGLPIVVDVRAMKEVAHKGGR